MNHHPLSEELSHSSSCNKTALKVVMISGTLGQFDVGSLVHVLNLDKTHDGWSKAVWDICRYVCVRSTLSAARQSFINRCCVKQVSLIRVAFLRKALQYCYRVSQMSKHTNLDMLNESMPQNFPYCADNKTRSMAMGADLKSGPRVFVLTFFDFTPLSALILICSGSEWNRWKATWGIGLARQQCCSCCTHLFSYVLFL